MVHSHISVNQGWWVDFFQASRSIFASVPRRSTNAQVRFILDQLNLKKGRRFLDCPCGIGRIAVPLARKGIKVTGVDITRSFLDELEKKAHRQKLKIDLLERDMRRITFDRAFDAAASMWTSFGYFEKASDNMRVLRTMFRALKPGGRFMLHLMNRDWIMAYFTPNETFDVGGIRIKERRFFDYSDSTSTSEWTFITPDGSETHASTIRMYSYHELIAMCEAVGFEDVAGYGSERCEPISRESRMMFIVATRPKSRKQ